MFYVPKYLTAIPYNFFYNLYCKQNIKIWFIHCLSKWRSEEEENDDDDHDHDDGADDDEGEKTLKNFWFFYFPIFRWNQINFPHIFSSQSVSILLVERRYIQIYIDGLKISMELILSILSLNSSIIWFFPSLHKMRKIVVRIAFYAHTCNVCKPTPVHWNFS